MTRTLVTFETIPEDRSVPDLPKEVNAGGRPLVVRGKPSMVTLPALKSTLTELQACLIPLRQAYSKYKRQVIIHKFKTGVMKRQTLGQRVEEMQQSLAIMKNKKVLANFSVNLGKTENGKRTRILVSASEEGAVINAASLSYLALEREPAVIQTVKDALDLHGTTVSSSRAICGSCPLHIKLEREIASFLEKEAGVIFPSGWMACMAPLKALATKGDVIFIDEASHDSFKTGARDSRAKVIKFKSNEPTALKRLISKHRKLYASAFIVIEAVSSLDGAILPEYHFQQISRENDCCLVVDVSSALGVWGHLGQGLHHPSTADVICGSFSQSLASSGGFVVGRKALMDMVAIFGIPSATNISNINVAAALGALRVLRRETLRVRDLQKKIIYARRCLAELGLNISRHGAAVIHIPLGDFDDVYAYLGWRVLWEFGIYCEVSMYPAVPLGKAGLRFAISNAMSYDDIDHIVSAVGGMMRILPKVQDIELKQPIETKKASNHTDFLSFAMSFSIF